MRAVPTRVASTRPGATFARSVPIARITRIRVTQISVTRNKCVADEVVAADDARCEIDVRPISGVDHRYGDSLTGTKVPCGGHVDAAGSLVVVPLQVVVRVVRSESP